MKQLAIVAVFLLISQTFASNVVLLNDSNFDNYIRNTSVALVEFTTSWCRHSKQLQPEFTEAANRLKVEEPTMTLINVDCDKANEICKKFHISEIPKIKLFENGEYNQKDTESRTANAIVTYMKSQKAPRS
mgnify:CR=1 FL=1